MSIILMCDSVEKTVGFNQVDNKIKVVSWCCSYFVEDDRVETSVCSYCGKTYDNPTDDRDGLIWESTFSLDRSVWDAQGMDMDEELRSFFACWLGVDFSKIEVSIDE